MKYDNETKKEKNRESQLYDVKYGYDVTLYLQFCVIVVITTAYMSYIDITLLLFT